jgi:hypothetical protein
MVDREAQRVRNAEYEHTKGNPRRVACSKWNDAVGVVWLITGRRGGMDAAVVEIGSSIEEAARLCVGRHTAPKAAPRPE